MRTVLHHFKYAPEFSVFISYSHVIDIHEEPRLVNPEFRVVLFTTSELCYDVLHHMYTTAGMAVLDITPDHILTAGKNTVFRIGLETYQFIFVNIRKVNG